MGGSGVSLPLRYLIGSLMRQRPLIGQPDIAWRQALHTFCIADKIRRAPSIKIRNTNKLQSCHLARVQQTNPISQRLSLSHVCKNCAIKDFAARMLVPSIHDLETSAKWACEPLNHPRLVIPALVFE